MDKNTFKLKRNQANSEIEDAIQSGSVDKVAKVVRRWKSMGALDTASKELITKRWVKVHGKELENHLWDKMALSEEVKDEKSNC